MMHKINPQALSILLRSMFVATFILIIFLHVYLLMPGVDAGIHMYGSLLISKGLLPYEYLWNNKPPLIYLIGALGFLIKSNPFLAVRLIELIVFSLNLFLINKIVKIFSLKAPLIYLLTFSAIYLVCWDQGFLTETFSVPLTLAAVFFFARKARYFEFIAALLLTLSFLLKQNAIVVIAGIMLVDVFSGYRRSGKTKKIAKYAATIVFLGGILFLILHRLGIWEDFFDQVFFYNSKYAGRPSLYDSLMNHFKRNSFLSVKGFSLVMVFNLALLMTLWKYWKMKKNRIAFELKDWLLINSILIYLGSYCFVYMSGKTYPHYFMLLIVPATFIMSHYVMETTTGKIGLSILLFAGFFMNVSLIRTYRDTTRKSVAGFLIKNTPPNEFIHIAGFGNQYLYVMADRLSNTKFLMPLFENNGYTPAYKNRLTNDFILHPPLFIILNRNSYRQLDPASFYTQTVMTALEKYRFIFQNEQFAVYRRTE